MPPRRPSTGSVARTDAEAAFDSITLHAFMCTLTVAAAVTTAYGPEEALHRIRDALPAVDALMADPCVRSDFTPH